MMVSELNEDQKSHLIWRIDAKTGCGLGWARAVAECRGGEDMDLVDVFIKAGKTPQSAKIHARKVINFRIDPVDKVAANFEILCMFSRITRDLSYVDRLRAAEKLGASLIKYTKEFNRTHKRMSAAMDRRGLRE